jgi:ATP-dependent Lon protease
MPQILERLCFKKEDVILSDSAIKFMIEEYSKEEKGVRTLIRTVESMMTRINMLRVAKHESMKDYKFYMDISFPLEITEDVVKTMLNDFEKKEPEALTKEEIILELVTAEGALEPSFIRQSGNFIISWD